MGGKAAIERVGEYSRSEGVAMVWTVRIDEHRMVSCLLITEVHGWQVRERPRLGWMDDVKAVEG